MAVLHGLQGDYISFIVRIKKIMEVGDLLFFGSVVFLLSYTILSFCYAFSKELFFYVMLRAWGVKRNATISEKIVPLFGSGLMLIEFVFDLSYQHQIKVRQQVNTKTYNMLENGQSINVLYIKESPKIARITDIPKERAYLGYYSLFFIFLVVGFYPIILLIIFFVSLEAVRFLLFRSKVNIDDE